MISLVIDHCEVNVTTASSNDEWSLSPVGQSAHVLSPDTDHGILDQVEVILLVMSESFVENPFVSLASNLKILTSHCARRSYVTTISLHA